MKKIYYFVLLVSGLAILPGCKKILEEKSDKKLVVPVNVADFQALLDNQTRNVNTDPAEGEISSTDYYLTDVNYASLALESYRRIYTWQKDYLFEPSGSNTWSTGYISVYTANTVLEGVDKAGANASNQAEWNNVQGQALFLRAKNFLNMANIWCSAYDPSTANSDLGLPLRLNSNFNEPSVRSTVQQTFDQIISDLKAAIPLLPATPAFMTRPSKISAYGMLARTFLSMRRYGDAGLYADSSLRLNDRLIDYNTLSQTANFPIAQSNVETVIYSVTATPTPINVNRALIDPDLIAQYSANDLRRTTFFKNNNNGTYSFKGNYTGSGVVFGGMIRDELYLIRAEALARENRVAESLTYLNALLIKRWKTGTFIPFTTSSQADALSYVLTERRKELLMRCLRWPDIKRLNKEGANITLTRRVNGANYILPPNDSRFALPIPEDVISLSGMPQNPR